MDVFWGPISKTSMAKGRQTEELYKLEVTEGQESQA